MYFSQTWMGRAVKVCWSNPKDPFVSPVKPSKGTENVKVKSMQLRSLLTMNYISHIARLLPETQATTTRFQGERSQEALPGRTASYKTCVSQRLFFTLQSL